MKTREYAATPYRNGVFLCKNADDGQRKNRPVTRKNEECHAL